MAAPLRTTATLCRPKSIRGARIVTVAPTAARRDDRRRRFHHFAGRKSHRAAPLPWVLRARGGGVVDPIGPSAHRANDRILRSRFSALPSGGASSSKSLRRAVRPFLMACHPDALPAEDDDARRRERHPLSRRARTVNLAAVQTVNGLIDALGDLIGRCTPPSYSSHSARRERDGSAGSLPELNAQYEIEFILPTTETVTLDGKPVKRKHRDREALTLRSVTVSFPEQLRGDVKKWALTSFPANNYPGEQHPGEEEAFDVAMKLRDHALGEFLRLLTVAGMQAPDSSVSEMQQGRQQRPGQPHKKTEDQWTLSDHFLHELGIDPNHESLVEDPTPLKPKGQSLAFFGRTQAQPSRTLPKSAKAAPPTYKHPHLQKQRAEFMDSIPWDRFSGDYDRAYADAEADWTTSRLKLYDVNTREGRERREQFVSGICSRVRIWRRSVDGSNGSSGEEVDEDDEIPEGLDVVAQLVAIRRLSLLLYDNFDRLRMEDRGRMWERFVIVLTPPRKRGPREEKKEKEGGDALSRPAFSRQGRRKKLSKWERRIKTRERRAPVSRGRMRHVAEVLLGPKTAQTADNSDEDGDGTEVDGKDEGDAVQEETHPRPLPESGFKFSYGTESDQGTGRVTAYIPVDFWDGELVRQLHTHLYDYFDAVCSGVGILRYGADGGVRVEVDGEGGGGGRGRSVARDGNARYQ